MKQELSSDVYIQTEVASSLLLSSIIFAHIMASAGSSLQLTLPTEWGGRAQEQNNYEYGQKHAIGETGSKEILARSRELDNTCS